MITSGGKRYFAHEIGWLALQRFMAMFSLLASGMAQVNGTCRAAFVGWIALE
jgi:hypothetical protein